MKKALDTLTTLVVLIVACAAGASMYTNRPKTRQPTPLPKAPVPLQGLPSVGKADAPYAILEFSDFECPYCGKWATETWPAVKTELVDTGKARFYFANFPLEQIHKHARPAAEAAVCAQDFFQAHDFLFANQAKLADVIGLVPQGVFLDELGAGFPHECKEAVDATLALGKTLQVTGTPAFFLGRLSGTTLTVTSVIHGAESLDAFTKEIR